ncbi:glycerol-3-phosphate phosphatase-like isoform X2 [Rhodnius prolixus]|uniref:glycerol-3-phosphate phosphatase-like isoform X2 n=1 Tax=Rhodnius prolixus TaxID=13249 RepID=UPI003D18ED11
MRMFISKIVKDFFHWCQGISRYYSKLHHFNERTMKNLNSLSGIEKKELFDSIDTVLFDCDGVIWLSSEVIPGALDAINGLKRVGKRIFFVTNNSTKSRADLLKKSLKLGFQVTVDEMITSAWLTAVYMKSLNFNKKAYLIGRKAIADELNEVGIECFGFGPDHYSPGTTVEEHIAINPDVAAVIVGHDIDFSFPKMIKACNFLSDPNCLFIGTNLDPSLPLPGNKTAPGAGSFVKAIETASGREPVVVGKPSKIAVDEVLKSKGLNPRRALMIGDRCTTDIAFGNTCSMHTLLVLTGIDTLEMAEEHERNQKSQLVPTFYADSIADLLKLIDNGLQKQ